MERVGWFRGLWGWGGGGRQGHGPEQAHSDLTGSAEGRVLPSDLQNLEDDKWHLKETVKHNYCIKSSVKVNYKIYRGLIEWVSGERSRREAAGEPQTVAP